MWDSVISYSAANPAGLISSVSLFGCLRQRQDRSFVLDVRSCHLILDGNPAGLNYSVSLFGCFRMQGRQNFPASPPDAEIEKKKKKPKSKFPSPRIPKSPTEETQILKIESHILKFGVEKITDSPTSVPKKLKLWKNKPIFENRKPSFGKFGAMEVRRARRLIQLDIPMAAMAASRQKFCIRCEILSFHTRRLIQLG